MKFKDHYMPRAINQPAPNVDDIVIEYDAGETPGDITVEGDGINIWLFYHGKAFARRENGLWVAIADN
jgi:hypothetical protein